MRLVPTHIKVRAFVEHHQKHIPAVALLLGAVWDFFTLGRPDTLFANASIISYLLVAGGCVLVLNARSERDKEPLWLVALLQFCFGNLASGLFFLYSQSATVVGSWLFLLILASFVFANEFARKRYLRLRSQLVAYHVLLTAYLGLVVPILVGAIGGLIFLLSCGVALSAMALYIGALYAVAPKRVQNDWRGTMAGLSIVTAIFIILYYLNLIPPVPLSLKEIRVYHSVTRAPADKAPAIYEAKGEGASPWYSLKHYFSAPVVHLRTGESAYCYSAVFAPDDLSTPIYHRYSYYDEKKGAWVDGDAIAFPIRGGRSEGYRGYTIGSVVPGTWRCSVETEGGALIGRATFTVAQSSTTPPLMTEYR